MKFLPRQTCGNDCGIFMLMYTLCIVMGVGFEFQEIDMPLIREWWCLLLMQRFEIQGHGRRFAFWTEEAKSLLQGSLQPVFRVQKRKAVTEEVPMHVQVAVNRAAEEKRLVDFILQSTGAEQHLVGVFNGKPSHWTKLESSVKVPVYLDSSDNQDRLFEFLFAVLRRTNTQLCFSDPVKFVIDVLFPEAITYGLSALHNVSMQEAKEVFRSGPPIHQSEVEEFNRTIEKKMKREGNL